MTKRGAFGFLLWAIAGASCAPLEDAFVGRYAGEYSCVGQWDDGAPYEEPPAPQTIDIQQEPDGDIFHAAQCVFPLRVVSATRAEYTRSSCNVVLSSGDPATFTVESGSITLREPSISYDTNYLIDLGSASVVAHCSFSGSRIE